MKPIKVVYITDEGYAMPTCISICSLIGNASEKDKLVIYVLGSKLTPDSKKKFFLLEKENASIKVMDVVNEEYTFLAQSCLFFSNIHVTSTALFKFNLPEIFRDEDRILYMDGDTLIQGSLKELYAWDIADKYVAAVEDSWNHISDGKSELGGRIGLKTAEYFNSGVMLLNLKKMREDDIADKLLRYRKTGINYFMDQDALNAVLGGQRVKLPYCYNFMSTVIDKQSAQEISEQYFAANKKSIDECLDLAVILHLTDKKKPWVYNMPWYSERFLKYYESSPYGSERLALLSPLKVLYEENKYLKRQINSLRAGQEFRLPFKQLIKNSNIVLYGAGKMGRSFYGQLVDSEFCTVVLWVDQKHEELEEAVASPNRIQEVAYSQVLIAINDKNTVSAVKDYLCNTLGVSRGAMISPD